MQNNRDNSNQSLIHSGLFDMVDTSAALSAAQRMYESNRDGFRHCCDTRELISTEEAMARDARDAARRFRRDDEVPEVEIDSYREELVSSAVSAPIDDDLADDPIVDEDDRVIELDDDDIASDDSIEVLFEELALVD